MNIKGKNSFYSSALDEFVYDRYDNDLNRRANKAHNLSTHIRFLGAGAPANNPEIDKLKNIQKVNKNLSLENDLQVDVG
jgi:hypothetical protein